jgi:hypothetical protein
MRIVSIERNPDFVEFRRFLLATRLAERSGNPDQLGQPRTTGGYGLQRLEENVGRLRRGRG